MGEKAEPITDKQWEELRAIGCKVPPYSISKVSAGRLLTFVKSGNATIGSSPQERARIALAYRTKYVGKKVRCVGSNANNGRIGVVRDLRARLLEEVVSVEKIWRAHDKDPTGLVSPFVASVRWDATETQSVKYVPVPGISLFYLELIEDASPASEDTTSTL
jgi:hypothetical protein